MLAVFAQYGEVVDVHLVRDKATGKSRGFSFLAYEDQRSTVLAVDNLSGAKVAGRIVRVEHVDNYKKKKAEVRKGAWALLCAYMCTCVYMHARVQCTPALHAYTCTFCEYVICACRCMCLLVWWGRCHSTLSMCVCMSHAYLHNKHYAHARMSVLTVLPCDYRQLTCSGKESVST